MKLDSPQCIWIQITHFERFGWQVGGRGNPATLFVKKDEISSLYNFLVLKNNLQRIK